MLVQWHAVHLSFPDKQVLSGVSFTVHRGEKIGLVGENGVGKTCLLRLLLGQLTPDEGDIFQAAGIRIGYLDQTLLDRHTLQRHRTCREIALEPFAHLTALEEQMQQLSDELAKAGNDGETTRLLNALGEVQEAFDQQGGYTFRARTEATLQGLGLPPETWNRPSHTLSAGQKVRLAIARLLLSDFDLLLLDEPTNHLDLEARDWLAEEVASMPVACIIVSHDRVFLDGIVSKIAHLDRGRLSLYDGNYSAFDQQRTQRTEEARKRYEKLRKQVRKLEDQARNYHNWANAKEKTKRGAGDKGYIGRRAAKLMKRSLAAKRRREKAMAAMKTEKPFEKDRIAIRFHGETGQQLLRIDNLSVGYETERPLVSNLSFHLAGGDRVAIQGPNGSGKTTLLRTVLGDLPPLEGRVYRSPGACIGHFDQENRAIAPTVSALTAVLQTDQDETLVRTVMGRACASNKRAFTNPSATSARENEPRCSWRNSS